MVLAVLERRCRFPMSKQDVYAATVGGVRLAEPAADLALALALMSSLEETPLPERTVLVGEIGLAGEIRPVAGVGRRLAEAFRLGFGTALVPAGTPAEAPVGMVVHEVGDLGAAVSWASDGPRAARTHRLG
jgi:DNA repair protein RadA/Sms